MSDRWEEEADRATADYSFVSEIRTDVQQEASRDYRDGYLDACRIHAEPLEAEVERLRAALKPFATMADEYDSPAYDGPEGICTVSGNRRLVQITIDDLRRARQALAATGADAGPCPGGCTNGQYWDGPGFHRCTNPACPHRAEAGEEPGGRRCGNPECEDGKILRGGFGSLPIEWIDCPDCRGEGE